MPSGNIVFEDDGDKAWCNSPCDALLIERKDGSHICSYCGREYLPNAVNKHKRRLGPVEDPYDSEGPELISLTGYAQPGRKKPTILDKEDKAFVSGKSGMSITSVDEWLPEPESTRER